MTLTVDLALAEARRINGLRAEVHRISSEIRGSAIALRAVCPHPAGSHRHHESHDAGSYTGCCICGADVEVSELARVRKAVGT